MKLVTVTDGVFNVYLGQMDYLDPNLFVGQDIWLGVTVEDDSEMSPRLRLGSVLYAFTAKNLSGTGDVWYQDTDGDGYGNPSVWVTGQSQPAGYVANNLDCNDGNNSINPDAEEQCDGVDNNCDTQIDENLIGPLCVLQDGVCSGATMTCGGTLGWLPCGPSNYGEDYEAVEYTCDGLDNDCDGIPDDDVNCDDGNPCTADVCLGAAGCDHVAQPGNACNDDDPCTVNDTCDGQGNCIGTPVVCDDDIPCTQDYCDGITGECVYLLDPNVCLINGECFQSGERNPLEECLECNPGIDVYGWTNVANGTPCTGGVCDNGVCNPQFR
jgi:hypothetical protein